MRVTVSSNSPTVLRCMIPGEAMCNAFNTAFFKSLPKLVAALTALPTADLILPPMLANSVYTFPGKSLMDSVTAVTVSFALVLAFFTQSLAPSLMFLAVLVMKVLTWLGSFLILLTTLLMNPLAA